MRMGIYRIKWRYSPEDGFVGAGRRVLGIRLGWVLEKK
jgi:hypothetical protein